MISVRGGPTEQLLWDMEMFISNDAEHFSAIWTG